MRIKKALLNTITSLLYQIITVVTGLIVPRLILKQFGSDCNGVVSSITQLMGIVSLLMIGLTAAARVELYKSLADENFHRTAVILNSTKRYMHKVAYVLGGYVCVLALLFPFFAHSSLPKQFIAGLVFAIGIAAFFEYFLGIPYRILLQADQLNYIENILTSISCIIYTISTVYMIDHGFSLIDIKVSSAILSLIVMLCICRYADRRYKLNKFSKEETTPLSLRKDAAVHSVANIIHQNSDIVILTLTMDAKLVSVYTVYYFVVGQIKKILSSFVDAFESTFGNIWAKKEIPLFRERFRQYEFIIFSIVIVIFSCTSALLIPFVSLYTKEVHDVNYIRPFFSLLLVITEMIYCIRQPYVVIVQAAGKYKETKKVAILEAGVNLTVSLLLVWKLGLTGVIIGTLLANLIRTLYYISYSYQFILFLDRTEAARRILWFCCTYLLCDLASKRVLIFFEIKTWIDWLLCGGVVFALSFTISLVSAFLFQRKDLVGVIQSLCNGLGTLIRRKT